MRSFVGLQLYLLGQEFTGTNGKVTLGLSVTSRSLSSRSTSICIHSGHQRMNQERKDCSVRDLLPWWKEILLGMLHGGTRQVCTPIELS